MKNITALKVKFLAPTNKKGARVKLTQMNNNKSCVVDLPNDLEVLEFVEQILKEIVGIKNFYAIVDNTQQHTTTIAVDTGKTFIDMIKEVTK